MRLCDAPQPMGPTALEVGVGDERPIFLFDQRPQLAIKPRGRDRRGVPGELRIMLRLFAAVGVTFAELSAPIGDRRGAAAKAGIGAYCFDQAGQRRLTVADDRKRRRLVALEVLVVGSSREIGGADTDELGVVA